MRLDYLMDAIELPGIPKIKLRNKIMALESFKQQQQNQSLMGSRLLKALGLYGL